MYIDFQKIIANPENKKSEIIYLLPQDNVKQEYFFVVQENLNTKSPQDLSGLIFSSLSKHYFSGEFTDAEKNFQHSLQSTNQIIKEITKENPKAFYQIKSLVISLTSDHFYLSCNHSFKVFLQRQNKMVNLLSNELLSLKQPLFTAVISDKIKSGDKIIIFSPGLLINPSTEIQPAKSLPELKKQIEKIIQQKKISRGCALLIEAEKQEEKSKNPTPPLELKKIIDTDLNLL